MKFLKCECGHDNPFGTEICESCGNPANEQSGQKLLNMRYEGVARRFPFHFSLWLFLSVKKLDKKI